MPLSFPVDCDTPRRRVEYCYLAQDKLRLLHNVMGQWYREGIPRNLWGRLPPKVRNRYPYTPSKLTIAQWKDFHDVVFERLTNIITDQLLRHRDMLKDSTQWTIDLDGMD